MNHVKRSKWIENEWIMKQLGNHVKKGIIFFKWIIKEFEDKLKHVKQIIFKNNINKLCSN